MFKIERSHQPESDALVPLDTTELLNEIIETARLTDDVSADAFADLLSLEGTEPGGVAYVYSVRALGTCMRKVGVSIDPARRCAELQTANYHTLVVEETYPFPLREAYSRERDAHDILKQRGMHVRGEWFDADGGVGLKALFSDGYRERACPYQRAYEHGYESSRDTRHVCRSCDSGFGTKKQLWKHTSKVHRKGQERVCPASGCYYSTHRNDVMRKHMKRAHAE